MKHNKKHKALLSLCDTIHAALSRYLQPNDTVIIGLSGGPDSVLLIHALAALHNRLPLTIIAAHVNHEWRSDAEKEAVFCTQLSAQLNVHYEQITRSELEQNQTIQGSREQQGRAYRRLFFERLHRQYNAQRILLAHHADDQQETFFIRLLRSSGIIGLAGMQEDDGTYTRPLLEIPKKQILETLDAQDIAYCTDETNDSFEHLRNRIRHRVIPALRDADSRFDTSFSSTHAQLQACAQFVVKTVHQHYTKLTQQGALDTRSLEACDTFLQPLIIQQWLIKHAVPFTPSHSFFNECLRFLSSPRGGMHVIGPAWCIQKQQHMARLVDTTAE